VEKNLTLSEIIRLNTDFDDAPENTMFASQHCALVINHQCVLKPTSFPPCTLPTTTYTPTQSSINATDKTSHKSSTNASITFGSIAAPMTSSSTSSTETVTAQHTTVSPCSEKDICSCVNSNLSSTVEILKSDQATLESKIKQLEIDLSVEKAVCQANKSALIQLQAEVKELKQINVTLDQQAKNMSSLEEVVNMLENQSITLQLALSVTEKRLKHVQRLAQDKVLACQSDVSKLMMDRLSLFRRADKRKRTVLNISKALKNTTVRLRQCQEALTPPTATSGFQVPTWKSILSSSFKNHISDIPSTLPTTVTSSMLITSVIKRLVTSPTPRPSTSIVLDMPATETATGELTRDLCPAADTLSVLQCKLHLEKRKSNDLTLEMTKLHDKISSMSKTIEDLKINTLCSKLRDNRNQQSSHTSRDYHSEE
jgi:septal ring factor EnvC (AmiA/AmiB activator)